MPDVHIVYLKCESIEKGMIEKTMQNIKKAHDFLQKFYDDSEYFKKNPRDKEYRYQHTLRVSKIADDLAAKEDLDREVVVIGALLHDISYANEFKKQEDWKNHGRNSAKIVQPFLDTLDLNTQQKEEILLGIACHVDGEAGMEGELTVNALTISDSDNLDRFDVFRSFENLSYAKFFDKKIKEQIDYLNDRLSSKEKLLGVEKEFVTETAKKMWRERIVKQMQLYEDLLKQLESGYFFIEKFNSW